MKKEVELKPCPFCGGIPHVREFPITPNRFSVKYAVQCEYTGSEKGCGAEGQINKHIDLAIEAWNSRPTDTLTISRDKVSVERLKKIVGENLYKFYIEDNTYRLEEICPHH